MALKSTFIQRFTGLSTDTKPTTPNAISLTNGSEFVELDTGITLFPKYGLPVMLKNKESKKIQDDLARLCDFGLPADLSVDLFLAEQLGVLNLANPLCFLDWK